jgi:isopenicillin N synthase-like dioxygenase
MKEVKHFFELPINEKMKIHMETSGKLARGYFNVDEEVTNGARDKKEGILIGR